MSTSTLVVASNFLINYAIATRLCIILLKMEQKSKITSQQINKKIPQYPYHVVLESITMHLESKTKESI